MNNQNGYLSSKGSQAPRIIDHGLPNLSNAEAPYVPCVPCPFIILIAVTEERLDKSGLS
jgi:hypothetical protein